MQSYSPPPNVDPLILAYWLTLCRAPRKAEPDADGSYSLGEVGMDVEKNWQRWSPYALAKPKET
jgi:hypothetical protein